MARRPTPRQVIEGLLDAYEPKIAEAFRAAIDDLTRAADLQRMITALAAGNLQAAIDALHLDAVAYAALLDEIAAAYGEAGRATVSALPALKDAAQATLVVRFDARSPRAEAWLRSHSADLVTRILDDQRTAIRQALTAGMEQGRNPRNVALDIVGRINRTTGNREGGLLGLTAAQERAVQAARAELLSDDPATLRAFLDRARRDRRFDRSIEKAARAETAPPADVREKALAGYRRRLLQLRGETIGRTDAMASLHAAQDEALRQAVESGAVSESAIRRTWKSAADARVRHTHRALNGDTVGLNERFRSPSGALLRFPGDPLAPADEVINCRCVLAVRIDFLANVA